MPPLISTYFYSKLKKARLGQVSIAAFVVRVSSSPTVTPQMATSSTVTVSAVMHHPARCISGWAMLSCTRMSAATVSIMENLALAVRVTSKMH